MPSQRWRALRYRLRLRIKRVRAWCHKWWIRLMWVGVVAVVAGSIVLAVSVVAPGVVGFSAEDSPLSAPDQSPPSGDELNKSRIEQLVVEDLNDERRDRGLAPVGTRSDLSAVANSYSQTMAEYGDSGHELGGTTPQERYRVAGVACRYSGETAAKTWYQTEIDTLDGTRYYANASELANGLVTQWMESPPHRDILLSPRHNAGAAGVTLVREDHEWAVYAVMDFCG